MRSESPMPPREQEQVREASAGFAISETARTKGAGAGDGGTVPVPAPISETTADRIVAECADCPATEIQVAAPGHLKARRRAWDNVAPPTRVSRDPLTDPRPGDRVRVRSGLIATVRKVTLGRPDSVDYVYADRDGAHYAAAAVSAWRSLCVGGKALEPEVQPGEAFDAVEVVR